MAPTQHSDPTEGPVLSRAQAKQLRPGDEIGIILTELNGWRWIRQYVMAVDTIRMLITVRDPDTQRLDLIDLNAGDEIVRWEH